MKKITVSIDEQTHRRVRILAAERGTSLSALIRDSLKSLIAEPLSDQKPEGATESLTERRRRLKEFFDDWDARGIGLRMSENLPREALYDRDAIREEHERFYRSGSTS